MLRLLGLLTLIGILVAGIGYYRGWVDVSSTRIGERTHYDVTLDKARFRQDKETAKQKLEGLRQNSKQSVNSSR